MNKNYVVEKEENASYFPITRNYNFTSALRSAKEERLRNGNSGNYAISLYRQDGSKQFIVLIK